MKVGDKVHCTAYVKRTRQGISIMDCSFYNDGRGKEVVYYDAEKNDMASIPYNEFTDVSIDKFKTIVKEFDGIYVGTTRLATKLTAILETPEYDGKDYIRFESGEVKKFAVIYYANNRKRLVPLDYMKGGAE